MNPAGAGAGVAPAGPSRARAVAIAVTLAVVAGGLELAIALHFDTQKAFNQLDLFFNADASARLQCMVDDRCGGRSSFSHPNLALFLNPALAGAAGVISLGGATGVSTERARRFVALCVSPLAAAVKAPIVFYLLLVLGVGCTQSVALSLLGIVSFSQLAFGAIPESFAISGALLALAYLHALRCMREGDRRLWPWVAIGVLITGVTLTNLVAVVILFAAVGLHAGEAWRPLVVRSGVVVGCVLLPTMALPALFGGAYGLSELGPAGGAAYTRRWLKSHHVASRAAAMPSAWAHTFAAPEPALGRNLPARLGGARYQYRFLIEHRDERFCFRHPLGAAFVGLFLIGALGYRRAPPPARWICGASLAILAFNGGLHAFWGVDLILYSQHWQLSLLVLLAGLHWLLRSHAPVVSLVFLGLAGAAAVENVQSALAMKTAMDIEHRGSGARAALTDYR